MKPLILWLIRRIAIAFIRAKGCKVSGDAILNGLPYVRRKGNGKIVIGTGVTINSSRWSNWLGSPGTMIMSVEDGAILEIKNGAGVSSSQLVANLGIHIGEDTLIGAGCLICDSDMHEVPLASTAPVAKAPIFIGNRVFIGARSIILKGVTIGDGSVVGAGSVVTKNIAPNCLAAGNPAMVIKEFTVSNHAT